MRRRKTALVTGAAVRLGRAFAEHLAGRGYDLVLHHGRSAKEAERLAARLGKRVRTLAVGADLRDPAAIAAMFQQVDAFAPRLDLLINSAAMFERAPFLELSDAQLVGMVQTNLVGPMLACRHAAGRMGKGAQIVNMLDIGGALQPWRGFSHYCAAKAGMAMLTRVLALELAPDVRVNGIAPGTVLVPESYSEAENARLRAKIPLRRFGSPKDILRALDYLLDAEFVTGCIEVVDGGRSQGPSGGAEVK